jgi:hypothetical protein
MNHRLGFSKAHAIGVTHCAAKGIGWHLKNLPKHNVADG